MLRKDKCIRNEYEIEDIINRSIVCRIGLCDNGIPYIVPVNFVYENNTLYIHSANRGKKIDIIKKNNNVGFEIDIDVEFVKKEDPCECTMKYRSVIGFGKAYIVDGENEKKRIMNLMTRRYLGKTYNFSDEEIDSVTIVKIVIEEVTGKKSEY